MILEFPLVPYRYAYAIGSLYFVAIWLFFFLRFPRHRRAMLFFGVAFSWLGILAQYAWWTRDWWHPITLLSSRVGVEDFVTTLTHICVPSMVAKYVISRDAPVFEFNSKRLIMAWWRFFWGFVVTIPIVVILFSIFQVHSFFATGTGMIIAAIYILLQRPDLGRLMIASSLLSVVVAIPMYLLGNIFSPGVIDAMWDAQISGIRFIGIPVEDLGWYLMFGFLLGGMYEYLLGYRLIKLENESFWDDAQRILNWLGNKVRQFAR